MSEYTPLSDVTCITRHHPLSKPPLPIDLCAHLTLFLSTLSKQTTKHITAQNLYRFRTYIRIKRRSAHELRDFPELCHDKQMVMCAVERWGHTALQYASEVLRQDCDVIWLAVKREVKSMELALGSQVWSDRELLWVVVGEWGMALSQASETLRGDRELVRRAISQNGEAIKYSKFTNDKELARLAIEHNPSAYQFLSEEMRMDRELAEWVITENRNMFQFVHPNLMQDRTFVLHAAQKQFPMDNLDMSLLRLCEKNESCNGRLVRFPFHSRRQEDT